MNTTMKTVEFKSKIRNNSIAIPKSLQEVLSLFTKKEVRVIVFMDEAEETEERIFKHTAAKSFLNGYADVDSIYD